MSFSTRIGACNIGLLQRVLIRQTRTSDRQELNKVIQSSMNLKRTFHLFPSTTCPSKTNSTHVNESTLSDDTGGRIRKQPHGNTLEQKAIPDRLTKMRVRLREKHQLDDIVLGTSGAQDRNKANDVILCNREYQAQNTNQDIINTNAKEKYFADGSQTGNENQLQTDFIRNLKDANSSQNLEKREAFVFVPFGLVRLDSMNNPKRPMPRTNLRAVEIKTHLSEKVSPLNAPQKLGKSKFFEKEASDHFEKNKVPKNDTTKPYASAKNKSETGVNLFDEQYFTGAADQTWNKSLERHCGSNFLEEAPTDSSDKAFTESRSESVYVRFTENEQSKHNKSSKLKKSLELNKANENFNQNKSVKLNKSERLEVDSSSSEKTIGEDERIQTDPVKLSSGNIFEDEYFNSVTEVVVFNPSTNDSIFSERQNTVIQNTVSQNNVSQNTAGLLNKLERPSSFVSNDGSTHKRSTTEEETEFHEPSVAAWEKRRTVRPIANIEHPTTGYDLAMKLRLERKASGINSKLNVANDENQSKYKEVTSESSRLTDEAPTRQSSMPRENKWSGRVDSKGFRILTSQIVDVQHLTQDELLGYLKDSIIYEDENLLAIDKPYGLPSHGGPGVHHSVGKLLQPLAARIAPSGGRISDLYLVHRLDKETTGVMVLAKSQQIYEFLLAMFKKRQVTKRYWMITKGIPEPNEGVIDIAMGEGTVGDRYRMELRPNYSSETRQMLKVAAVGEGGELDAVTHYRVLSTANSSALVECTPETGVKHQIRCHMAFGLNTPILGDHKYSHYTKMVPQRLHPEMLQRLGIRQSKVRHVPMHLHAKALVLPEFKNGRNLFLSARLPKHFVQNMKWLKLTPPS